MKEEQTEKSSQSNEQEMGSEIFSFIQEAQSKLIDLASLLNKLDTFENQIFALQNKNKVLQNKLEKKDCRSIEACLERIWERGTTEEYNEAHKFFSLYRQKQIKKCEQT